MRPRAILLLVTAFMSSPAWAESSSTPVSDYVATNSRGPIKTTAATAPNIVVNGSFEDPVIPDGFTQLSSIPGCTVCQGPGTVVELNRNDPNIRPAAEGGQLTELDSDASIGLCQTLATDAGRKYKLRFAFSPRPGSGLAENQLEVSFGGVIVDVLVADGSSLCPGGVCSTAFTYYEYVVTATGSSTVLKFRDVGVSNSLGTVLDDVSVLPLGCASINSGTWDEASTWDCGVVPGFDDDVRIRPGHTVTIGGDAFARSVMLDPTSTVSFFSDWLLKITTDWVNNSGENALASIGGIVQLGGADDGSIKGAYKTKFVDLEINKPLGKKAMLEQDVEVTRNLTLRDGMQGQMKNMNRHLKVEGHIRNFAHADAIADEPNAVTEMGGALDGSIGGAFQSKFNDLEISKPLGKKAMLEQDVEVTRDLRLKAGMQGQMKNMDRRLKVGRDIANDAHGAAIADAANAVTEMAGALDGSIKGAFQCKFTTLVIQKTSGASITAVVTVIASNNLQVVSGRYLSGSEYHDVEISPGATMEGQPGGSISITGDWVNDGSFVPSTSTMAFNGTSPQMIGGSTPTTFHNLTIDNPGGGVTLHTGATVQGHLDLETPLASMGGAELKLGPDATVKGPTPTISIGDVSRAEGSSGITHFEFTVTLSAPTTGDVTVGYAAADGSSTLANMDYQASSGTATIPAGEISTKITVDVLGDATRESDETFFVNLSNATGGTIIDGQGTGTIINDDGVPTLSVNDVSQDEGNGGKTSYVFKVTESGSTDQQVTVDFVTADGTATLANNDYQRTSGTLTFPPKTVSGTAEITVSVNGDVIQEGNETVLVQLSNPVNATLGTASVGTGTIVNDDGAPGITIDDVKVNEGNSGKTLATLMLHLSHPSAAPVTTTVQYSTADGTATVANNDYQAQSGIVTFPDKTTSATIMIAVNGDINNEGNESFFVNLQNATNGVIADDQAIVMVNNDDDTTPPVVVVKSPNGGEILVVNRPTLVSWNTTDTQPCTVDIYLSRDKGANYEVIALGQPDAGTFRWVVTAPGANVDATPVFQALIKVVAHDCAKNTGEDESDNLFALFDLASAALLSVFEVSPVDEGVELRWQLAPDALIGETMLERGDGESGPWAPLEAERRVEWGVTVVVDRTVELGKSYYYRLSGTLKDGQRVVLGTLEGKAGERITEFALKSVYPNPTHGMLRMEYTVPQEARVTLRVVDVAGRVVAKLVEGTVRPGRYQAVWNGRGEGGARVGAGMYFVRFQVPGKNLVQRVAVAQ